MEGDRRCAQGERMEGDTGDKGDKEGPGKCKKGESPVSVIVLMVKEAVEREQRRGARKIENKSARRGNKFYKNENQVLSFLEQRAD
jgi:hypothetical protein